MDQATRSAVAGLGLALCLWITGAASAQTSRAPEYRGETPVEKVLKKGAYQLSLLAGGNFMMAGVNQSTLNVLGSVAGSVEFGYRLTDELAIVAGLFGSDVEVYNVAQAHVTIKYHWLELHSRIKPFVLGGISHQWLFPSLPQNRDRRTVTSAGVRVGTGMDVVLTPKVLLGLVGAFDMGPRLLPNAGVFATFKLLGGVTFVF